MDTILQKYQLEAGDGDFTFTVIAGNGLVIIPIA
jgi:hypothetical protein